MDRLLYRKQPHFYSHLLCGCWLWLRRFQFLDAGDHRRIGSTGSEFYVAAVLFEGLIRLAGRVVHAP